MSVFSRGAAVGIVPDHKGAVNHDAGIIDIADDRFIVGPPVIDALPHLMQILRNPVTQNR